MLEIEYREGCAISAGADTAGNVIIAQICNDLGRGGTKFFLKISAKWRAPYEEYLSWFRFCDLFGERLPLGEMQLVRVENRVWVANLIGQHQTWWENDAPPIRYEAVEESLVRLAVEAERLAASVVCPKLGCYGGAGGKWKKMEPIIRRTLSEKNIPVIVYQPPPPPAVESGRPAAAARLSPPVAVRLD